MKRLKKENALWNWTHFPSSLTLNWEWLFTTRANTTKRSNNSKRRWSWTRTSLRREPSFRSELDPLSLIINAELGMAFYYAREYDQAIEQFKKTLELDQNFPPTRAFLLAAYEQKGMYNEAIAEFKKALPLRGISEVGFLRSGLGHIYAVSGKKTEARKLLAELKQLSEQR